MIAKGGCAVLCYDPIGQGERKQLFDSNGKPYASTDPTHFDQPGESFARQQCCSDHDLGWNAGDRLLCKAGLTFLPDKIGCTGISGGGTNTSYLMALDDRITAAAPGCYLTGFRSLFDTIGPQDAEQNIHGQLAFGMDHADYVLMRLPKPTLIMASTQDYFDIGGAWNLFRAGKRFATRQGFPERIDLVEPNTGHGFPPEMRVAAANWMRRWLLDLDSPITEGDLDLDKLSEIINLKAFYRHWALESLTGFWDGYSSNQNNYYVYFSPKDQGRAQFIPWGADWVFSNRSPFARGGFASGDGPSVIYAQAILTNRLYHSKGGPQRYRETMQHILDEVWDEDKMLAEVDRIEKLITPFIHPTQEGTPQALNELREFIRGRRQTVKNALDNWSPNVPSEPRKPTYVVDVGKVTGSFSTLFSDGGRESRKDSTAEIIVELDGEPIQFDRVSVRAQIFQFQGFGGFGAPPRGNNSGGSNRGPQRSGGGFGQTQSAPAPVNLVFTGERSAGQPITISLMIDRDQFKPDVKNAIRVTGSFHEGGARGFGFGGGPRRSIHGELRLTQAGTDVQDKITGTIDLSLVETHGGFFQQRRGGGGFRGPPGGRGNQRRGFGSAPPASGQPPQAMTLQRALDSDQDQGDFHKGNGTSRQCVEATR